MALVSEGLAWPHTPFGANKTASCGYEWSLLSREINTSSLEFFTALPPENMIITCILIMYFMDLAMA